MKHVATITRRDVLELADTEGDQCISIYLPTHESGKEIRQDPIRLKNALRSVQQQLQKRNGAANTALDEVAGLVEQVEFWRHQKQGLAIFVPEAGEATIAKLPFEVDEIAEVAPQFHLSPLAPALSPIGRFCVLVVSQNEVHLLDCTSTGFREVETSATHEGRQIIGKFIDQEKQLQFHSVRMAGAAKGKHDAIFHGHGGTERDDHARLKEYFGMLNDIVHEVLNDRSIPVIFTGVAYLYPIFREAANDINVLDDFIAGNQDDVRAHFDHVYEQASEIMAARNQEQWDQQRSKFAEAASKDRGSEALQRIVPAAVHGLVDTLMIQQHSRVWGEFNMQTVNVDAVHDTRQDGDQDLVNLAFIHTLRNSGVVVPEYETDGPALRAIFRVEVPV